MPSKIYVGQNHLLKNIFDKNSYNTLSKEYKDNP